MPGDLTVSTAIDKFLEYQKVRKGRPETTIQTYRSSLLMFQRYVGDIPLSALTIEHIDSYAESLDISPKTIKNRLTPIRSMIKFLYAKSIVSIRPESIDLPQVKEIEANFLSFEEQEMLLSSCNSPREKALTLLILRCGARVSEIINIRTDDMCERSIVIRRGKGGKPRPTFITPDAEQAIRNYHATLGFKPEYLVCGAGGNQLSRQYVHRVISTVAERSGIAKNVSPKTLRHTFATNLLRKGARVEDVQPMMGHVNIRTTMIYMHFTNDYLQQRYDDIMLESP